MDPIWRFLPDHIVLRILEFSNEIEQRIAFKIHPKKIIMNKNFQFRNEIVYDNLSKIMWDFMGMADEHVPYWIKRKGVNFSYYSSPDDLYIFNVECEDYDMTLFDTTYQVGPSKCNNNLVLNKKVKFI